MNLSDTAQEQCNATWPGDSDIAGLGAILGFTLFTWTTILVSGIAAGFEAAEWWSSIRSSSNGRSAASFFLTKRPTAASHQRPTAKLHRICLELRGTLCDVQTVTGTGILVAALAQRRTITFYHEQAALACWFQTLNSLWEARDSAAAAAEPPVGKRVERWRFCQRYVRKLAFCASLVLSTTFQVMVLVREEYYWDNYCPGRCYIYQTGDYSEEFWCVVTGLYAIYMFLEVLSFRHEAADEGVRRYAMVPVELLAQKTADSRKALGDMRRLPPETGCGSRLRAVQLFLREAVVYLSLLFSTAILWLVLQFFAISTFGNEFRPLEFLFQVGFAAWNTWWLFDLRELNKGLLESSEDDWGFGQVLPLVLLLTIAINYVDAHSRVVQEESQRPE